MGAIEVLGLDADRDLIRSLCEKRASEDDPWRLCGFGGGQPGRSPANRPKKGGHSSRIGAARRWSAPDLDLARSHEAGRKIDCDPAICSTPTSSAMSPSRDPSPALLTVDGGNKVPP